MALGSNTNCETSISRAISALKEMFPDIIFTRSIYTKPIGMESPDFLNCLAAATTTRTLRQTEEGIKGIEKALGDKDHDKAVINIDIDILLYGTRKLHAKDWEREYVKALLAELRENRK